MGAITRKPGDLPSPRAMRRPAEPCWDIGAVPHDNTEGDMSRLVSVLGTNTSLAAERASAAIVAALLGLFILYGVGFAQMSHETAHDTRHATGFPCH